MNSMIDWFYNLTMVGKCLVGFCSLPIVFLLLGIFVFLQEPPDFGKERPRLLNVLGSAIVCGFVVSVVLSAIFGCAFLLYRTLDWMGFRQGGVYYIAFFVCLIGVLGGIGYWFEGRPTRK